MKTDRIFVLLLVVLLPMSGCFDDTVGDAEGAEENSGTTVNHHYYNNTTNVLQDSTVVMTVHIEEGQTHTVHLNGTTLQLMDVYSNNNGYWQLTGGNVGISMDCENGFTMITYINYNLNYDNPYLPTLPDTECELILNYSPANSETLATEKILIFTETDLISL